MGRDGGGKPGRGSLWLCAPWALLASAGCGEPTTPAISPRKPLLAARASDLKKPTIVIVEPREGFAIDAGEEFAAVGLISADNGAIIPAVVHFRIVDPRGRESSSRPPASSERDIGGRITVKGSLRAPRKPGEYAVQIRASDYEWARVVEADPKAKESDGVALSPKVKIKVKVHARKDGKG